jgi:Peptidase C13 family
MRQDLIRNLKAGLRVALFMRHDVVASWAQFGLLFVLSVASTILWNLLATGWPAHFNSWSLPSVVYFLPLVMLATLVIAGMGRRMDEVLPLLVAILAADLWLDAFVGLAHLVAGHAPRRAMQWAQWALFYLGPLWLAACIVVAAARRLQLTWPKRLAAVPIALVLVAVPLLSADFTSAVWTKADRGEGAGESYGAVASEDVLYLQPSLLERDIAALLPRKEGGPNLYLVGVAGYGQQNVFRREVEAVDALFADRFGTRGRSIKLINNAATVRDTPIATRVALARVLKAVGARMKPDEDVLFLFLTSHGSKDGRLSLSLWPLRLNDLAATDLKAMLDDAGIRNRVIVVSACYSGAFIEALRDDDSLILTASSKDRNSFGCSNEAEWTYFGKAYFDQALRGTDSFSEAFDRALPVIAGREKQEDYDPSEPQRHVGARIEEKLAAWRASNAGATR